MKNLNKALLTPGLLALSVACGDGQTVAGSPESTHDGGDSGKEAECVTGEIRLNFEGVLGNCPNVVGFYDSDFYCPLGQEGQVQIEGYKGEDREAEIGNIRNFFECFFEPLGIKIHQSEGVMDMMPSDEWGTSIHFGGKVPMKPDSTVELSAMIVGVTMTGEGYFSVLVAEEAMKDEGVYYKVRPRLAASLAFQRIGRVYGLDFAPSDSDSIMSSGVHVDKIDICKKGFTYDEAVDLAERSTHGCSLSAPEMDDRIRAWQLKNRCEQECIALTSE